MDREDIESRRAENQFWNGAENYQLRADFEMYRPDGEADLYFNTIIGLVYRLYDYERLRPLFNTFQSQTSGAFYTDLFWLGLEGVVFRRAAADRPVLEDLRRQYALQATAQPRKSAEREGIHNLRWLWFRRALSMYVNVDAASLVGADTLRDGEVVFREGPISKCARLGGFGVLDEVNMAKNEALAVLHATLDFRRVIDVPGYDRIVLDDAARFIGTMNYGYAGTRELNEALVSRFVVMDMPVISPENLEKLLLRGFPQMKHTWVEQFSALFGDLRQKCDSSEISTKALDLRGLLSALHLMEKGIPSGQALELGIINKAFDPFERQLVADAVWARIPRDADRSKLFEG